MSQNLGNSLISSMLDLWKFNSQLMLSCFLYILLYFLLQFLLPWLLWLQLKWCSHFKLFCGHYGRESSVYVWNVWSYFVFDLLLSCLVNSYLKSFILLCHTIFLCHVFIFVKSIICLIIINSNNFAKGRLILSCVWWKSRIYLSGPIHTTVST